MSAPMMVLLSLAMAHANGSLLSATAEEERLQASRPFHRVGRLDVAHARRIGGGLRPGVVLMGAEDNRFASSRPRALEIGNCVLCARAEVAAAPRSANAKMRCLIVSSPADDHRRRPVKVPAIILQVALSQAPHTPDDPC